MGCIHSKSSAVDDSRESPPGRVSPRKQSSESKADNSCHLVDEKVNDSDHYHELQMKIHQIEKLRRQTSEVVAVADNPRAGRVPRAAEGEQVAAGWPAWLSAVAGEAINGWLPRKASTFEKLDKIGQGTYSSVYRARDVVHNKIVALKKVRFDNMDPESVKFMCREIVILRRLDHPNVIKLESMITSQMSCSLYLVFEYMEHDLTGLAARPGIKFTEPQIKCYMKQLLSGLDHCHKHDILHRDIKGSNLLINNSGVLKIADFGLASFFDHSSPLTSRVVTLWYRPPELIMGASQYGVDVDMWSTGCILGELYTGKPILPGKTEVEQLHKIFKLCGSPSEDYWTKLRSPHSAVFKPSHPYRRCITEAFKELPSTALGLMETLLSIDPTHRGSAALALSSEFFTTGPVACDPSSLPKYPPSKEIDAKLREEARRRREARVKDQQPLEREVAGDCRSNTGYNPTIEQVQGRHLHSSTNTRSEIFASNRDKATSGYSIGSHKKPNGSKDQTEQRQDRASFSGPLVSGAALRKGAKEASRPHFSTFSGLLRGRKASVDNVENSGPLVSETQSKVVGQFSGPISGTEPIRKRDNAKNWMRSLGRNHESHPKEDANVEAKTGPESEGNDIYLSGPLLVSSNNVDWILKDHDRRIQEHARRARTHRSRVNRPISTFDQNASRTITG